MPENIDQDGLQSGQTFKNFKELYFAVFGEEAPQGGRNKKFAEDRLKQYISYEKLCDIDPTETSKRTLVITEVYETPRKKPENRGKHGTYADLLKPLLLDRTYFEGKLYTLACALGLFSPYLKELLNAGFFRPLIQNLYHREWLVAGFSELPRQNPWGDHAIPFLCRIPSIEFEDRNPHLALNAYCSALWYQMRRAITTSLEALARDEAIKLEEYHMFCGVPEGHGKMTVPQAADKGAGPEAHDTEEPAGQEIRDAFLRQENCILRPTTLDYLDVYSRQCRLMPVHDKSQNDEGYKQKRLYRAPHKYLQDAEDAVENLQDFFRQYVFSCWLGDRTNESAQGITLRPMSEVPDKFTFFQDRALCQQYKSISKVLLPALIHCSGIWSEIRYRVNPASPLTRALLTESFDRTAAAAELSRRFLDYMEKHLDRIRFRIAGDREDTFRGKLLFVSKKLPPHYTEEENRPLSESRSARALHQHLKQLYE